MNFIIERIKEPSTWAGLSALGVLFGLPVGAVDAVHGIAIGVASLAAMFLKEKTNA